MSDQVKAQLAAAKDQLTGKLAAAAQALGEAAEGQVRGVEPMARVGRAWWRSWLRLLWPTEPWRPAQGCLSVTEAAWPFKGALLTAPPGGRPAPPPARRKH